MNKKLITLAAATVIATLAPGLASAGEIDELKQAMKQMQERLAQLEGQWHERLAERNTALASAPCADEGSQLGVAAFIACCCNLLDPDGQVKFPHPWPPQIPPGRTAGL